MIPAHLALAAYCAGLCLSIWLEPPWTVATLVAGGLLLAAGMRRVLRLPDAAVSLCIAAVAITLLLAAGWLVGGLRLDALGASDLRTLTGSEVRLAATVADLPKLNELRATVPLEVTAVDGRGVDEPARVTLDVPDDATAARLADPCRGLTEGTVVVIDGVRVRPLPDPPAEGFDYGRYLRRKGEHVLLSASLDDVTVVGRRGGLAGLTDTLRRTARASLRRGVPSPVREVLQGMVLGDDENFDPALAEDFRRSGLMHIMAVSGENVVLVCTLLGALLAAVGIGRRWRLLLLLPAVAAYVVLAGSSPSIVRAGIAGGVVLVAGLVARPTDAPSLLLIPAAIMLTLSPNTLFDVSFQLSFAAVAGLFLLAGRLTHTFRWLPGPLSEQAGVTTAASLATAPVSLAAFGQVSLVAVPANLVGGFVLGPVMLLGMLSVAAGLIWSGFSVALNLIAGTLIAFLVEVAHLFAGVPGSTYSWHGVTLSFALVIVAATALVVTPALAARHDMGVARYLATGGRGAVVAFIVAIPIALSLLFTPAAPAGPGVPTVTFLDVGEGAATLVQVPGRGAVLVDAGPGPLADDLWRHGVRRIELLVLSHGHADHIDGLEEIIGSVPIDLAVMPRPPTPYAALDELEVRLRAAGTEVQRCTAPRSAAFGALTLRLLPSYAVGSTGNQAENDDGVVVLVESQAGTVLLPGDAEAEALEPLELSDCDVVGAPHHGSDGGFTPPLLERLRPRLVVIPVGERNRHGHPDAETLDVLAEAGVPCLRTDLHGEVAVSITSAGLAVAQERSGAADSGEPAVVGSAHE